MKQNFLLIGEGYWGKKIKLVLEQFSNVIVCDPLKYSTAYSLNDYLEQNISAIFIATPEQTHYNIALECLKKGKPTFVEKPLCLHTEECQQLIELAVEKNTVLYADYIFLFDELGTIIKQLLQQEVLGEIKKIVSLRYSSGIYKSNIVVTDDLAVHDFSLMRKWFGSFPKEIQLLSPNHTSYSQLTTDILYTLPYGFWEAHYSWNYPYKLRQCSIQGQKGQLEWRVDDHHEELSLITLEGQKKVFLKQNKSTPLEQSISFFLQLSTQEAKTNYVTYQKDTQLIEQCRRLITHQLN